MPLSAIVLAELHAELEALQRQRRQFDERIEALQKILHIDTKPAEAHVPVTGILPMDMEPKGPPTVKAVVLGVLRENPGVKAAFITRVLRKRGYKTKGPTRLSHRVYNELWRMWRDGEITKT